MLNRTNIDVQIYVNKLIEGINQMGLVEILSEEWGIEKQEELKETLEENFIIQASLNFEEFGDPVLDEKQFEDLLIKSATECILEDMTEEGILVKKLEDGGTENVYSINPERVPEDDEE